MSLAQDALAVLDSIKASPAMESATTLYTHLAAMLPPVHPYVFAGYSLAMYLAYSLTRWIVKYIGVRRQVRGLPTIHSAVEIAESGARMKLPNIPMLCPINKFTLYDPWKKYSDFGSDLFACTQLSTPDYAVYVTCNPDTAMILSSKTSAFGKPTGMFRYKAVNIFGEQIVSTQTGHVHRRHKGVVKACFGENVMQSAWDHMINTFAVMVKEEGLQNGGVVHNLNETMIKLTLCVFVPAAFGVTIPWTIPKTANDTQMPFPEALQTVEDTIIPQLLVPLWLLRNFPLASVRRIGQAQDDFRDHLYRMYREKRAELSALEKEAALLGEKIEAPGDILGSLVHSQMDHEAEERLRTDGQQAKIVGLTESEIIGNMFIFIVAGHETTAHTLAFTQAFLALHPEWQDKLYDEITAAAGDGLPTYRDMTQLPLCLAACQETIRLRDIVMTLPKQAMEDTTLPYTTWDAYGNVTRHVRVIKKGSHIVIDTPAAGRNPFAWSDAMTWNPARFLENTMNKEGGPVFAGFSLGVRQCIGKRFAEVEMVAYISHLVKTYRLVPMPKAGESREEMRDRMLEGVEELTLAPKAWPIRLEKR